MSKLETSTHLSQPTLYQASDRSWHQSFNAAIEKSGDHLTWDPAAIISLLSFNYVCGNRTLVKEIKRQPWLSSIDANGEPILATIPAHGYRWLSYRDIASQLLELLCNEVEHVCRGQKKIYILLSGGLDSRVVAGIYNRLLRSGRLKTRPIAVTWGLRNSRDVVYGQRVAQSLDMDWIHVDIGPQNILENIDEVVESLGTLVPPVHLHCMSWFKGVTKDSLVLAGSYGDSVGRAEFSGSHLLELKFLQPKNIFGLLESDVASSALEDSKKDLCSFHLRASGQPKHVLCEHEMAGHYMRGMIAQAMSIINNYCSVYQVFTDPKVYSFMWSIHPSRRNNNVYACLLNQLEPKLAPIPWARTNKALFGKTEAAISGLNPKFHAYRDWIQGPLYAQLYDLVDPIWFSRTGLFSQDGIENLRLSIQQRPFSYRNYDLFTWLASFRKMAVAMEARGLSVNWECQKNRTFPRPLVSSKKNTTRVQEIFHRIGWLRQLYKRFRHLLIRLLARLKFPPENNSL